MLTEPLDRLAIRMAGRSIPSSWPHPHHAEEALELIGHPDFFSAGVGGARDLAFRSATDFHFSSPIKTPWKANNEVHGRLFRSGPDWEKRPTVILLHGWNSETLYRWHYPFLAWRMNRLRMNVATIVLPYHGLRRPCEPNAIRGFISHDLLRMVEAARQSIADIRALTGWLWERGNASVGVWGISLGGWLAGLLAVNEARVSFAVLMTPVVRMDRALADLECCAPIRRTLDGVTLCLDQFTLSHHVRPRGAGRILLIASEYDLLTPLETVEELWKTWEGTEIWRYPHGHISILGSLCIMERTMKWIAAVVGEDGKKC